MDVYIFRNKIDLSFIKVFPGDLVVIKPNLVKESKEDNPLEWESVITLPSIIGLVCEDVCRKLQGRGRAVICDAPQTDSSFSKIAERLKLYEMARRCSEQYGIPVEVVDLRSEEWENEKGIITRRHTLPGDPRGVVTFNLGKDSLFAGYPGEGRYYGADYDTRVVNEHHRGETQEYLVCATPIMADVFINLAKMKTHKKTGVTLCLKNVVGINANKNWLPHYTQGFPKDGGDEFPDLTTKHQLERLGAKFIRKLILSLPHLGPLVAQGLRKIGLAVLGNVKKSIRSGNWHGNNTTWRMALDLNRCLLYGNKDGTTRKDSPKRFYCLVDGVVGMEGNGPMQGEPVYSNIVIGGTDPVAVDMVTARVMGFEWRNIPIIQEAFTLSKLPITFTKPEEVNVVSEIPEWNGRFFDIENHRFLNFAPSLGWKGYIEYDKKA